MATCECGCGTTIGAGRFVRGHNRRLRTDMAWSSFWTRFWNKVERTESCWLWHGTLDSYGYGVIGCPDGKMRKAHRLAYESFGENIPPNLTVDHLCRVKNCLRPDHLEIVTSAENVR